MKIAFVATVLAAMVATAPAGAATYLVHYNATAGTILPTKADFRVTTSNTLNSAGGYDVLALTGKVNGVAVSGLAPINPPGFLTDNILFTSAPYFSAPGLGFTIGTTTGNLFFTDSTYILDQFDPSLPSGTRYFNLTEGTVTIAAVPEPASWAMLTIGFAMVGATVRRRQVRAVA